MPDAPCRHGDRGSAVVDFVLVGGLLVLCFAGVVQLALGLYVHNVLVDCAGEGARWGAQVGHTPADGAARAAQLIADSLDDAYATDVTATRVQLDGRAVVQVEVHAPLPLIALIGPTAVVVDGHAAVEQG